MPAETGIPQEGSFWLLSISTLIAEATEVPIMVVSFSGVVDAEGVDSHPVLINIAPKINTTIQNRPIVANFFMGFKLVGLRGFGEQEMPDTT